MAPIVTGDAVILDIRIARAGSRALALLLDLIVQVIIYAILSSLWPLVLVALSMTGLVRPDAALVEAIFIVMTVVVLVGYPTLTLTVTRGRTIGKLVLGLRVVRDDGGPIGFRHALTRTLVGVAVEFPAVVFPLGGLVLSLVSMMSSPVSKRVGDHAAGTIVIHERDVESWGWVPAMPPGLAGWAATLDLAALDDELALAVRHFLARNRELREPDRTRLGRMLARQVAEVTTPPPPPGTPGWAYLAAVHAERHRRAVQRLAAGYHRTATLWPELVPAAPPRAAASVSPTPQPPAPVGPPW